MCKTKIFQVQLDLIDPTGVSTNTQSFSMEIIDDPNCMRCERLYLYIGEFIYHIDKKGNIIDKIK
jgi:hypothetical protein